MEPTPVYPTGTRCPCGGVAAAGPCLACGLSPDGVEVVHDRPRSVDKPWTVVDAVRPADPVRVQVARVWRERCAGMGA